MAKHQARTPGRDIRGGRGKGTNASVKNGSSRGGKKFIRTSTREEASRKTPSRQRPGKTSQVRSMSDIIEGRHAVQEALGLRVPLVQAYVQKASGERDARLAELISQLTLVGVPIQTVSREQLDKLSSHGAHQGIVVRTKPFHYAELTDLIDRADKQNVLVVVLDHITDEGNFGAIVRSAEVVGASGIIIPKARSVRVGTAAYKTSAGAVLHVPIAQVSNLAKALDQLKQAGFWVVGSTEHADTVVWEKPFPSRCALVMGSEGEGISRLVLEKCDLTFRLPQRGRVESLNVAQAATVMCYEWLRTTYGTSSEMAQEMKQ